jgi:hypothetical protein
LDAGGEDGLPSLIPEAQIRSSQSDNTRFLDYLGSNGGTDDPLLIVETKRPNSLLPKRKVVAGKGDVHSVADEPMASVLCDGLKGVGLTGNWNKWLETLRDYVNSVFDQSNHVPRRVVIVPVYVGAWTYSGSPYLIPIWLPFLWGIVALSLKKLCEEFTTIT